MELQFATQDLKMLCEDGRVAEKLLGTASARRLRARLADLRAAPRLADVRPGHPHPLKGDRDGQFAVSLAGGDRLVFSSGDDPVPRLPTGQVDWSEVKVAKIEFIGDYHD
jgi:proteic killer suppression protein